jgi:hypothetical protein
MFGALADEINASVGGYVSVMRIVTPSSAVKLVRHEQLMPPSRPSAITRCPEAAERFAIPTERHNRISVQKMGKDKD